MNTVLVETYWQVGRYIVEYEQQGRERAEYGSNLPDRLLYKESDLEDALVSNLGQPQYPYI